VRRRSALALTVGACLVLAGCATVPEGSVEAEALECPPGQEGCDEILPVGPGGDLEIEMGNFFFNITDGVAVTGEVDVTVINVSDAYHNAEFLGAAEGSAIPEANGNETGEGTVLLFPGEWTVICNVPGHRAAGMETTITVYATEEEAAEAVEAGETDVDRDMAEQQG
jgi:plastocyanin